MRTTPPAFRNPRVARLSPLAACVALALAPSPAPAATYLVSNTAELITAINDANFNCPSDPSPLIQATGPFVVSTSTGLPSFGLPTMYCGGTLEGGGNVNTSAPLGYDTGVTLNGSGTSAFCGLTFDNFTYGGTLTIRGMRVENFTYGSFAAGICGAVNVHESLLRNNTVGVLANTGSSTIGDSTYGGNVIIGNTYGIWNDSQASIGSNKIGTANGTTAVANQYGVYVSFSSSTNISNNQISGNTTAGIYLDNDYGGSISGNYIGTTADGDGALPNGDGIYYNYGGSVSIDGNIISGNAGSGVVFDGAYYGSMNGNAIGVGFSGSPLANNRGVAAFCSGYIDLFGNDILSNSGDGVLLDSTDSFYFSGNNMSSNAGNGVRITTGSCFQYGSFNSFWDNEIVGNGSNGVLMTGLTTDNSIHYGRITGNGLKNISLNGGSNPLPNDSGDGDGGPNRQQNYPVISSVVQDGSGFTTINFSLDSSAFDMYEVQFYSNPSPGKPAGDSYLGSTFVYGDGVTQTYTYYGGLVDNVSATATSPDICCGIGGDTSEFSPMKAALSAPTALISPSFKNFGNVVINGASPPQTFIVRSTGDQPYLIYNVLPGDFCYGPALLQKAAVSGFCYGSGFTCSSTCSTDTPYATNSSCSFTVQFTPVFAGFQSDSICIQDNTAASPHFIYFQGTGTLPPPLVIEPATFDFGNVAVGHESESMRFKVTNQTAYGTMPVSVGTTGGEFDVVNDGCSPAIPAHGDCFIDVTFAPSVSGGQSGALVVTGQSSPPAQTARVSAAQIASPSAEARAELQGVGVSGGILLLPNSIDMGAAQVGGAPITYVQELRNTGYGPLTISSITASSPFTLVNNCPATLAPNQACTVTLGFAATALGEVHGSLVVVSSAEGGSREIPVTARGQTVAEPLIRITPTSLGFGSRMIGSASNAQEVTITNIGGATATLDLSITSIDFLISGNSCGGTLAPQASCSANVAFRPLGFGTRLGSFNVTGNAANSPQALTLTGTGCRPFTPGGSRFSSASSCSP